MNDKPRILVVDDEPQIIRVLRTALNSRNYDVNTAADGVSGLQTFEDWRPDLVITDLAMPNMDGLEFCKQLRTLTQVPIIVLSAKSEEQMKVDALDSGADDFVAKPFGFDELLARIRVCLRRAGKQTESDGGVLEDGDFRVELTSRLVTVAGREIHLTPKEFDLVVYFMNNAGKVLTHRTLLNAGWGSSQVDQSQYLRVFIANVRKKLEPSKERKSYIVTEPWIGYRFVPSGQAARTDRASL